MARTSPLTFVRQVRQEVSKVTWPNRRETIVTTAMVFIFVTLAALFFTAVDSIISFVVKWLLSQWG